MFNFKRFLASAILAVVCTYGASAQEHEAINEANNPLTPKITINFHNYYVPELTDLPDKYANQFLLRGLIPSDLFGAPQLFRFTLPIATAPTFPDGETTGC